MGFIATLFILLIAYLIIWGIIKSAFNSAIKEEPFQGIMKDLIKEALREIEMEDEKIK